MRQARPAELGEPFGAGRHQFEIGAEASGASLAQHRDPAVGVATPRPVHRLVRARQSKMQNSRRGRREIEVVGRHLGRHALMIEMGAPAVGRDIESVDAHRRAAGRRAKRRAVDAARVAFREEKAPEVVIADDPHRLDRKFGIEALEVEAPC